MSLISTELGSISVSVKFRRSMVSQDHKFGCTILSLLWTLILYSGILLITMVSIPPPFPIVYHNRYFDSLVISIFSLDPWHYHNKKNLLYGILVEWYISNVLTYRKLFHFKIVINRLDTLILFFHSRRIVIARSYKGTLIIKNSWKGTVLHIKIL